MIQFLVQQIRNPTITWYGSLTASGIMEWAEERSMAAVVAPVTEAARFPDRHASFSRQPCSPMNAPTVERVEMRFVAFETLRQLRDAFLPAVSRSTCGIFLEINLLLLLLLPKC